MRCPGELFWNDTAKSCDFVFNVDGDDSGESSDISNDSSSSEESKEYDESKLEEFAKAEAKMAQAADNDYEIEAI